MNYKRLSKINNCLIYKEIRPVADKINDELKDLYSIKLMEYFTKKNTLHLKLVWRKG
jgi:hypothetical protein